MAVLELRLRVRASEETHIENKFQRLYTSLTPGKYIRHIMMHSCCCVLNRVRRYGVNDLCDVSGVGTPLLDTGCSLLSPSQALPPNPHSMPKIHYQDEPEWADVVPLAQDDGGPNALSVISYTDEYSEAISYLRAVMADNEHSDRVLKLTAHIIDLNPAHYTVW